MPLDLEGKHVVITGGDGALGQAVVQTFRAAGAVCHLPILGPVVTPPGSGVLLSGNVNLTDEAAKGFIRDLMANLAGWARRIGGKA